MIHRDVSAELAEFFLEEVTPAQGGSYHCCYWRRGWDPDVWSHPSDALELLVTGEVLGERGVEKGHRWDGGARRESVYVWRGACTMTHTKRVTCRDREREFSVGMIMPPFPPRPPSLAISGDISACPDGEGCATGITWVGGQRRYNTPCVQGSTTPPTPTPNESSRFIQKCH